MTVVIRDAAFNVVSKTKNLRGILDYSRTHRVDRIDFWEEGVKGTGQLGITWVNGSSTITDFADAGVMRRWVRGRRVFAAITPVEHGSPR